MYGCVCACIYVYVCEGVSTYIYIYINNSDVPKLEDDFVADLVILFIDL